MIVTGWLTDWLTDWGKLSWKIGSFVVNFFCRGGGVNRLRQFSILFWCLSCEVIFSSLAQTKPSRVLKKNLFYGCFTCGLIFGSTCVHMHAQMHVQMCPLDLWWNCEWKNGKTLCCMTKTEHFRFWYLVFVFCLYLVFGICIWPNGAHGSNHLVDMLPKRATPFL